MKRRVVAFVMCLVAAASAAAQTPTRKVQLVPADSVASLTWTTLASDPKGDGLQARLPDARELSYAIEANSDRVWFKVAVYEPLPEQWFGISIAIDSDDVPDNGMAWWGSNKAKFDRLATAFLFKAEGYWQGYAGVGDSDSIGRGNMTNVTADVKVALDREHRSILLGIPRASLGPAATIRVLATVGSMLANNDDIPNEGMVTVRLKP